VLLSEILAFINPLHLLQIIQLSLLYIRGRHVVPVDIDQVMLIFYKGVVVWTNKNPGVVK
jgi:hypothetical protein